MQIATLSRCHYDRNETILLTGTSSYASLLFFFHRGQGMSKTVGETLLNPSSVKWLKPEHARPAFLSFFSNCLSEQTHLHAHGTLCVFSCMLGVVRMAVVSAESRGEQREGPLWWHVKVMSHSLISFIKNKAAILIFVWCL